MGTKEIWTIDDREQDRGFCPECGCGYPSWTKHCPLCRVPLDSDPVAPPAPAGPRLAIEELVALVEATGGTLSVPMKTAQVARARRSGFPYQGYGYSWAKRIEGEFGGHRVTLWTRDVGMHRFFRFPYRGYGFAWARGVVGDVAGNPIALATTRVEMEKDWGFPYFGFGYAWAQEMSGRCGEPLQARFLAKEVGRERKWAFPYRGFGFAWVARGDLILESRR